MEKFNEDEVADRPCIIFNSDISLCHRTNCKDCWQSIHQFIWSMHNGIRSDVCPDCLKYVEDGILKYKGCQGDEITDEKSNLHQEFIDLRELFWELFQRVRLIETKLEVAGITKVSEIKVSMK